MRRLVLLSCLVVVILAKKSTVPNCNEDMKNGCPKIFDPLCASNGKTYANLCELCVKSYNNFEVMKMYNLTIEYEGECRSAGDVPINGQSENPILTTGPAAHVCDPNAFPGCPQNYDPVCGSDGQTYANECVMCAQAVEKKIAFVSKGPCKKPVTNTVATN